MITTHLSTVLADHGAFNDIMMMLSMTVCMKNFHASSRPTISHILTHYCTDSIYTGTE